MEEIKKLRLSPRTKRITLKLTTAAIMLAAALVFPTVFHAAGLLGAVFLPMHFPVLLCGILCGALFGGIIGAIAPILSSLISGMPVLFPSAFGMSFELMAYGVLSGLFTYLFKKKSFKGSNFFPLFLSMLLGRCLSGLFNSIFFLTAGVPYSFQIFLSAAFISSLPGIILQLIVIPALIVILENNNILKLYFPPFKKPLTIIDKMKTPSDNLK